MPAVVVLLSLVATVAGLLLAPLVRLLQRRLKVPRVLAALLTMALASTLVLAVGWMVVTQAVTLLQSIPQYQQNISEKLASLRGVTHGIQQVSDNLETITEEAPAVQDVGGGAPSSVSVSAVPIPPTPRHSSFELVQRTMGPLVGPLATGAIVLILMLFMLIYKESLRDRFLHIVGRGDGSLTSQAIDDATGRISRYLLTTLFINALYGLPIGIGLFLLGVPNAFLWGLLATLLRFIPYVGPWVAALMPISLSLAVFPGWERPAQVLGLFLVMELISNNLIEPWLYGKRTGLSAFAILLMAFFWSWLWGGAGLFLAVPLTLCLAVAGRYVPELSYLHLLLSDDPSVKHHTPLYHRLLAFDAEGAQRLAREQIEKQGLVGLYDEVLLPALCVYEQERGRGILDKHRAAFVERELRAMLAGLDPAEEAQAADAASPRSQGLRVLCLSSGGGEAEALGAQCLARAMGDAGYRASGAPVSALAGEAIEQVEAADPDVVLVFGLSPDAATRALHLSRRLRASVPDCDFCAVIWGFRSEVEGLRAQVKEAGANSMATSIAEAREAVRQIAIHREGRGRRAPAGVAVTI